MINLSYLSALFLIINNTKMLGIAEKRGGARGPENVWGAAGMFLLCYLFNLTVLIHSLRLL